MIPEKTYQAGWPERLVDNQGLRYVRLRDGKAESEWAGESCLYGELGPAGFIHREFQFIPTIDATLEDMSFSGGTWMSAEQLIAQGQTPIVIPPEPVEWPA